MWKHFIDCIINDKEPRVTAKDGAIALEIMGATLKSMKTGSWVELPLKEEASIDITKI